MGISVRAFLNYFFQFYYGGKGAQAFNLLKMTHLKNSISLRLPTVDFFYDQNEDKQDAQSGYDKQKMQ